MCIGHTLGNPDVNRRYQQKILNQSLPNSICKSHPKNESSSRGSLVPLPGVWWQERRPDAHATASCRCPSHRSYTCCSVCWLPPCPPLFTGFNNMAGGEWRGLQSSRWKEKFFKSFPSSFFIKRKIPSHIHTFAFFMMYLKGPVWPHCVTSKAFSQQFTLSDCFTILKQLMIKLLVSNPHYKAIMSKSRFSWLLDLKSLNSIPLVSPYANIWEIVMPREIMYVLWH